MEACPEGGDGGGERDARGGEGERELDRELEGDGGDGEREGGEVGRDREEVACGGKRVSVDLR